MERKLATILAADVFGYSRLMGQDEEGTLTALRAHREAVDRAVAAHGGRVFGSAGDSLIAEFSSAVEAVRCAIEIQAKIAGRNAGLPEDRRMHFRIGVNVGDVMIDGDNLFGDGVNVAARLEQLAEPGGICISGTVFDHVKRKVVHAYESLGEQILRNIAEPVRVYRLPSVHGRPSPAHSDTAGMARGEADAHAAAIRSGREAVKRHDWSEAVAQFREAHAAGRLPPEDMELFAEALWWNGQIDDCINVQSAAYTLYLEQGNRRRAAALCAGLAENFYHKLASSVASGWLRRAEHLLEEETDSLEHAYLVRFQARLAFDGQGDLGRALELAERVSELGIQFRDRDLQMLALHDRGSILLAMGRVDDGLALMEEAMVAAVAGELSPMTTGRIYCNMIGICEKLADYRRAGEWDEEARRWCERFGHRSGFPGVCRIKRAELMRLRGAWAEAEAEARRACGELKDFLGFIGQALQQVGEIRLARGDLAGAEEAFRQAHERGGSPEPGLARIRLAQGNAQAARPLIDQALAQSSLTRLDRARLLPIRVEVALALHDLDAARSAAEELSAISQAFASKALEAAASHAQGSVWLADGQAANAAECLRRACTLWRESGLPHEEACSRLLLGMAYRAQGDEDFAELELSTAHSVFERLGAALDLRRSAELLQDSRWSL